MPVPEQIIPSEESLRSVIECAWRDFQHARDQTWRALQIVAVLGAGLVTVDAQFKNVTATILTGCLIVIAAISGILIAMKHRKVQRQKYIHIMNCQAKLGLHQDDLIPLRERYDEYEKCLRKEGRTGQILKEALDKFQASAVSLPRAFPFWQVFNPLWNSTDVFIIRMHCAVILFAILLMAFRCSIGH